MRAARRENMREKPIVALAALLVLALAACNGGQGGGITLSQWWNGVSHGTVWGDWALQNSSEGPPTSACNGALQPPRVEPAAWWASVNPNITGGSDSVAYTVWSNTRPGCSRALQTVYRSEMVVDLSSFYAHAAESTTPLGARINQAFLTFNVIPVAPPSNPLGWACDPYLGAVGVVSVLKRNAVITQGPSQLPLGSGLIQASPSGPFDAATVMTAFPAAGDTAADLSVITGPGSYDSGKLVITDTGPGIHAVKIDVSKWVIGAVNLNMQSIGFTVAGLREGEILLSQDVQFECRTWVQPTQLNVLFL
jgi:hypothetical protein